MAFFGVTKENIHHVSPVEGSDFLDVAKLSGMDFPFVVRRGEWKPGDSCIYFPVDCVLPLLIQEKLGLVGKLAGGQKDRIKTVKLRGQISMGVVAKSELFDIPIGVDLTEYLGVVKYEQPVVPCKTGNLLPLPPGQSKYDIEGADRYNDVFRELMASPVVVTEKLEGQNVSFTLQKENLSDMVFYVNQRNYTIIPLEGKPLHEMWVHAENLRAQECMLAYLLAHKADSITLYGEFIGPSVQGNIYKLKHNEIRFFDMKLNRSFVNHVTFVDFIMMYSHKWNMVPIIAENVILSEVLNGKTTQEYSHGKSVLNSDTLREGVVYKPMVEQNNDKIGRLILKTRDPIYLEKTGN